MSDPLGVAGSAVGIVSLGLQVCQGLIQYVSAVKGRKDEIEDGIQQVQRVVSLLYSLNNVLPDVDARRCTQSLQHNLNSCYTKLEKMQAFLDSLQPLPQPENARRIVRDVTSSLIYPFQQAKLNSLNQSLRKDLGDIGVAIQILSMELTVTIRQDVQLMAQDANTNSTHQLDHLQALQTQVQQNSNQLDSLRSTIAGTLETIRDQLHQTQLIMHDHGQRVRQRLTVMEANLDTTITNQSAITCAKLDEMAQILSAHTGFFTSMEIQMSKTLRDTQPGAMVEDHVMNPSPPGIRSLSRTKRPVASPTLICNCASTLPKSRMSFTLWQLKFEYEEQEQHHRGCEFYGIHRNKKKRITAQLPYKVAWFSARMAFACFEYEAGMSRPGMAVRYKNIVHDDRSPVVQIFKEFRSWDLKSRPGEQIVQDMETMERRIRSMYRDRTASPYDRNEYDMIHAEIFFKSFINDNDDYSLIGKMIENSQILWAVLRVFQKLLEINNDTGGTLFAEISQFLNWWQKPIATKTAAQNAHDLLCNIAKVACLGPSDLYLLTYSVGDPVYSFVQNTENISPLHRAIIIKSLHSLIACVQASPKSVLEPIFDDSSLETYTVLHMAADWPEGLQYLLSTEARGLLNYSISSEEYLPPVGQASRIGNAESVTILMEAGCCLELSHRSRDFFWSSSTKCMKVIASYVAKRRLQLLKLAQEKLGGFLDGNTVTFADSEAARICDFLDEARIPVHPSLRVEKYYTSIYSYNVVRLILFPIFWDNGFQNGAVHDNLGLAPAMTYRPGMFYTDDFLDSYYWMRDNGFLGVTPTDPLKLGFNLSSTGYHYIGAIFGTFYESIHSYRYRYQDAEHHLLIKELSSISIEDECACWCNMPNHGCSPIKLLLKSHLDECQPDIRVEFDILRHIIFHHELFDETCSPDSEKLTCFVTDLLRLLTFEALEMTHTCCTFNSINAEVVKDFITTASCKPAAIFSCGAKKVRKIRSCAEEISRARLLEDLMLEFTSHLTRQGPGCEEFEYFIEGYWRQRISQLYEPDPQVVREMEQHQVFKGFNASSGVERYVLPKRVLRLLGRDFKLTRLDYPRDDAASLSEEESTSEAESLFEEKPFCEYCDIIDSSMWWRWRYHLAS